MKSGASDPFDDADDAEAGDSDKSADETEAAGTGTAGNEWAGDESDPSDGLTRSELPYVLRREKVKDERPEVHQLFVREATHEKAIEAERELADAFDEDLSRTDAREAIYLAGMEHLGDAESILRKWGYDL